VLVGHGKNQTVEVVDAPAPSNAGIPTFDDSDEDAYWSEDNPLSSTLVAGHGVAVTVTAQTSGGTMTIDVSNPD
jgi:immune inhibitor A